MIKPITSYHSRCSLRCTATKYPVLNPYFALRIIAPNVLYNGMSLLAPQTASLRIVAILSVSHQANNCVIIIVGSISDMMRLLEWTLLVYVYMYVYTHLVTFHSLPLLWWNKKLSHLIVWLDTVQPANIEALITKTNLRTTETHQKHFPICYTHRHRHGLNANVGYISYKYIPVPPLQKDHFLSASTRILFTNFTVSVSD